MPNIDLTLSHSLSVLDYEIDIIKMTTPLLQMKQLSLTSLSDLPKVTQMLSNGAKICSIKSRTHTLHVDDAEQFSSSNLSFFKARETTLADVS